MKNQSMSQIKYQENLNNLRSQFETLTDMLAAVESPTVTDVARLKGLQVEMQKTIERIGAKMSIG